MTTASELNGPLTPAEAVEAERAMRRCILNYCRGIDRCDAGLVASAFHADGTVDYGSTKGLGSDFAKNATTSLRAYAIATKHFPSDSIFEFTSRTTAESETQVLAWHRCSNDGGEYLENFAGRYFDTFELRDGDWRISHRRLTHDWDAKFMVEPAFTPGRFVPSPRN
jgi:hypothetical protein